MRFSTERGDEVEIAGSDRQYSKGLIVNVESEQGDRGEVQGRIESSYGMAVFHSVLDTDEVIPVTLSKRGSTTTYRLKNCRLENRNGDFTAEAIEEAEEADRRRPSRQAD